jgi:lysophospholipase L1-like esterase
LLRILSFNAVVFLGCLAVLELAFGGWVTGTPLDTLNIPRDVTIHYDVAVPDGPAWHGVYHRDRWGLRGDAQSPGTIELLTIGGSTTDQRLLSDSDTWQAALSREAARLGTAVVVANAGIDGQSSLGHLKALDAWLPHIPGLHPRVVLAYVGINDTALQPDSSYDSMLPPDHWRRRITDRSALYRLWRTLRGMIAAEHYSLTHDLQAEAPDSWTMAPAAAPDAAALAAYAARLRQLATRIRAWNATPIFVTQPMRDMRVVDDHVMVRPPGAEPPLRAFNQTTLAVCREMSMDCLDLATELRFERGDFYDGLHYTPQGAARIGRWLGAKLYPALGQPPNPR